MVLSLPVNSFSSSNTFLTAANILWKWVHLLITFVCIKYVLLYYLLHLPLTYSIVLISCERGYNHYFFTSSIIFVSVYNISTSVETAWSIVIHVSVPRTTLCFWSPSFFPLLPNPLSSVTRTADCSHDVDAS